MTCTSDPLRCELVPHLDLVPVVAVGNAGPLASVAAVIVTCASNRTTSTT